MSKNQPVSLGEYWNDFIESMLKSGRYVSTSELMHDSVCKALIAGEESGSAFSKETIA